MLHQNVTSRIRGDAARSSNYAKSMSPSNLTSLATHYICDHDVSTDEQLGEIQARNYVYRRYILRYALCKYIRSY